MERWEPIHEEQNLGAIARKGGYAARLFEERRKQVHTE